MRRWWQSSRRAGLEAQSLSSHYAGRQREQGLLLSFAGFTDKELRAAAKRLVEDALLLTLRVRDVSYDPSGLNSRRSFSFIARAKSSKPWAGSANESAPMMTWFR